jgi:hypothetical protein
MVKARSDMCPEMQKWALDLHAFYERLLSGGGTCAACGLPADWEPEPEVLVQAQGQPNPGAPQLLRAAAGRCRAMGAQARLCGLCRGWCGEGPDSEE